jgi:hypothetical protein
LTWAEADLDQGKPGTGQDSKRAGHEGIEAGQEESRTIGTGRKQVRSKAGKGAG